ncbi:MAG: hypothetical protein AUH44_02085 [Chloroflexi bacterium 13_1_40CM_68_15]|nr:MAG: hypothetical protein AUH44_02085 [Chloroflexi bacterium 13_1_40CM_68_15]
MKSCGRSVHVISESASAKAVIAIANGAGATRRAARVRKNAPIATSVARRSAMPVHPPPR